MEIRKLLLLMLPMMVFASNLQAVSLVETKREESQDIMYLDGHRMLITSEQEDIRMIMDLKAKKSYMVNTKNKSALDMSEATWKALHDAEKRPALPKVDARLEKVGPGPEIAGYDTTHYIIYVDGNKCAEKWTSEKALRDSGFYQIWDEFGDFLVSASISAEDHPCELAEYQVFRDDKYGLPLKDIDRNCETDEILRIERNVDIDRALFEVPSDYKVVKMPTYEGTTMNQGNLQEDGTWSWGPWQGMDCSGNRDGYSDMYEDGMDEEYFDEEYADEDYADEDYADEDYADEEHTEEAENLEEKMKSKFKGLMNKFKKEDKDEDS